MRVHKGVGNGGECWVSGLQKEKLLFGGGEITPLSKQGKTSKVEGARATVGKGTCVAENERGLNKKPWGAKETIGSTGTGPGGG